MATKIQRAQLAIYNPAAAAQMGRGGGRVTAGQVYNTAMAANKFAKDKKLVTAAKNFTDAVGLTKFLDNKTAGLYTKGTDFAKSQGYVRKTKKAPDT